MSAAINRVFPTSLPKIKLYYQVSDTCSDIQQYDYTECNKNKRMQP
jgi:hypothetical protein